MNIRNTKPSLVCVKPSIRLPSQQRGAILLISLIILVLLTLVTFAASRDVILQQKMTATIRDNQVTFEVAEEVLMLAEAAAVSASYDIAGTGGYYDGECDNSNVNCHVVKVTDLYNENSWANKQSGTTTKACDKATGGDCSIAVNFDYMIIDLGEMDNFGLSSSNEIRVISDQYIEKEPGGLSNPRRYKVIARAKTASGAQKILVSYYALSRN